MNQSQSTNARVVHDYKLETTVFFRGLYVHVEFKVLGSNRGDAFAALGALTTAVQECELKDASFSA